MVEGFFLQKKKKGGGSFSKKHNDFDSAGCEPLDVTAV